MQNRSVFSTASLTAAAFVFAAMFVPMSAGARTEFVVKSGTAAIPGAEICFFRASARGHSPADYWFASNDVRCLPADKLLDLPVGRFHYFGRSKDHISGSDGLFYNPERQASDSYHAVEVPVVPSATVTFAPTELQSDSWAAILAGPANGMRGGLFPVAAGTSAAQVPANVPLLPLLIRGGAVTDIGGVLTASAGEVRPARFDRSSKRHGNAIVWVDVDASIEEQLRARTAKLGPLSTQLRSANGQTFTPVFAVGSPYVVYAELQVFLQIPAGGFTVSIEGDRWEAAEVGGISVADQVTTVNDALVAVPAGVIQAHVRVHGSVPVSALATQTCAGSFTSGTVALTLLDCGGQAFDRTKCRASAQQRELAGSIDATFTRLPIGVYYLEVAAPGLDPKIERVAVVAPETVDIEVTPEAFPIFGRITRGGKPVHALLQFAQGTRAARDAVSDEDGRYEVLLARSPLDNAVEVHACDQSFDYVFTPATAPTANTAFDIRVPATALNVHVLDESSRESIAGAIVFCKFDEEAGERPRLRAEADAEGHARFTAIERAVALTVCASAQTKGYVRESCTDSLTMKDDETRNVEIQLTRDGTVRGRLIGASQYSPPILLSVGIDGSMKQRVRVADDGTFWLRDTPNPDDYFVLLGPGGPLYVLLQWTVNADGVLLSVPPAPIRSFAVRAAGTDRVGRLLGLSVGGRHVPAPFFLMHLMNRRIDISAPWKPSLPVPDIAQTGAIAFTLGPLLTDLPVGLDPDVDFFVRPEFASLRRTITAGPSGEITFP